MAAATRPQRAALTPVVAAPPVEAGLLEAAGAAEDEPEPDPEELEGLGEFDGPADPAPEVELPGGRYGAADPAAPAAVAVEPLEPAAPDAPAQPGGA